MPPECLRSVIVVLLVLLEVPGSLAQSSSAARAPNRPGPLPRLPDILPLCIESATLLRLPAQVRLEGMHSPGHPEQHSQTQAGQQDDACQLEGHCALRWFPPRRFVSRPWPGCWASGKRVALRCVADLIACPFPRPVVGSAQAPGVRAQRRPRLNCVQANY